MDKEYIVYKTTNEITGKIYIGISSKGLEPRIYRHKQNLRLGLRLDTKFMRSLRKHGVENFTWQIIERCSSWEECQHRERYYIEKFNTFKNGYNMTLGGDGGNTLISEEIKERHRRNVIKGLIKKGRPRNEKTWYLYDKNEKQYILTGREFKLFCRDNGLNDIVLRILANHPKKRKYLWHRGYTCFNKKPTLIELKKRVENPIKIKQKKIAWIFYKNKKEFLYNNRKEFCKDFSIPFWRARRMTEQNVEYKGWTGKKIINERPNSN